MWTIYDDEPTPEPDDTTLGVPIGNLVHFQFSAWSDPLTNIFDDIWVALKDVMRSYETGQPVYPSIKLHMPPVSQCAPGIRPDLSELRARKNHGPSARQFKHLGR